MCRRWSLYSRPQLVQEADSETGITRTHHDGRRTRSSLLERSNHSLHLLTHPNTLCPHTLQGAGTLELGSWNTTAAAAAAMINYFPPVLMITICLKMRVYCCPPCAPLWKVELMVVVVSTWCVYWRHAGKRCLIDDLYTTTETVCPCFLKG